MIADFKKNKKRNTIRRFLLVLAGLLILFVFVSLSIASVRIYQKRMQLVSQVENLENKIQDLKNRNSALEQGISRSDDDKYIEKIAREELDLQKPGEKVFSFLLPQNQQQKNEESQKNVFQIWLGWLSGIFK